MNLAPRTGSGPFWLEKWYIDTLMPSGDVLLVYLGWLRLLGLTMARVTAELFRADGSQQRGWAAAPTIAGGEDLLRFGPARIEGRSLSWETDGLSGELRFEPRHGPVRLREPFLRSGRRQLHWTIEIPDADVEGEVRWPGGSAGVTGRGYRDRVCFDLPPWRFPIRELRWGRAVASDHAAVWVDARCVHGAVRARWEDGTVIPDDTAPPMKSKERVLLETDVVDLDGMRLGWLRPVFRRLPLNPHEVKWHSGFQLSGEDGYGVHERVVWR